MPGQAQIFFKLEWVFFGLVGLVVKYYVMPGWTSLPSVWDFIVWCIMMLHLVVTFHFTRYRMGLLIEEGDAINELRIHLPDPPQQLNQHQLQQLHRLHINDRFRQFLNEMAAEGWEVNQEWMVNPVPPAA